MLSDAEQAKISDACRVVPLTGSVYLAQDYVTTLVETVVDYQLHTTTVIRAMTYFQKEHGDSLQTLESLKALLGTFPDDRDGNTALAMTLWNYKLWRRASELRGLVAHFKASGIDTLSKLRDWAANSSFRDHFQGRVKGLGETVYQWLVMRLGVETVKPDVHIVRFVSKAIGRNATGSEAVSGIETAAVELGVKANLLDWSIWEYARA